MFDRDFYIKQLNNLLSIDSTTGQYEKIERYICGFLDTYGIEYRELNKGGVIGETGGMSSPLVITSHLDDIGLMVRAINKDGTLNVCPVGGLYPFYCVGENVRIHTFEGKIYTGTVCRIPNSIHVTEEELRTVLPDFRKNVCVLLDCNVKSDKETRELGIETGDIIALDPRTRIEGDYIKSRFLDDKACAALLLLLIKEIAEKKVFSERKIYLYFSMYEEIGHGTSWIPDDVSDILAVDIAPTGPEQTSDEFKVSVFAKDSRFPYHRKMTKEIIETAKSKKIDYTVDIFTPHYGTDDDTSLVAGHDVRHAAIGPGTQNSHGYERMNMAGIINTYELMKGYIERKA